MLAASRRVLLFGQTASAVLLVACGGPLQATQSHPSLATVRVLVREAVNDHGTVRHSPFVDRTDDGMAYLPGDADDYARAGDSRWRCEWSSRGDTLHIVCTGGPLVSLVSQGCDERTLTLGELSAGAPASYRYWEVRIACQP
ncbi:hypothetical protein ANRL2_00160 [Anaerolineae bacterium]|nr:hypothetical protein ANRL2_00160 [Anaerolineae bacterium]